MIVNNNKYNFCITCGSNTICSYLPNEIQRIIVEFAAGSKSHLECPQCTFIRGSNIVSFIKTHCDGGYDYHEETDQIKMVNNLISNKIIDVYPYDMWDGLKHNFTIPNIMGNPTDKSLLIDLVFINWLDSNKCGLVENDKKIIFEIVPTTGDVHIQIILFLEKLLVVNYITANDSYDDYKDYDYDDSHDNHEDYNVLGDFSEDELDEPYFME